MWPYQQPKHLSFDSRLLASSPKGHFALRIVWRYFDYPAEPEAETSGKGVVYWLISRLQRKRLSLNSPYRPFAGKDY